MKRLTALEIYRTIVASAKHQIATTPEGKAIEAGFSVELEKLVRLIARNAAQGIELDMLFEEDDDFIGEEPTVPLPFKSLQQLGEEWHAQQRRAS